ncbi:MAG TPA: hypothetical protein VFF37_14565, partial [Streptomyces sp.]|nr:hypothetical protein [Streptomyces sp.]
HAGIRSVPDDNDPLTPQGNYTWIEISDALTNPGFPAGACSISVADNGFVDPNSPVEKQASVQVLTEGGAVFQTTCAFNLLGVGAPPPFNFNCDEAWTPVTDQP